MKKYILSLLAILLLCFSCENIPVTIPTTPILNKINLTFDKNIATLSYKKGYEVRIDTALGNVHFSNKKVNSVSKNPIGVVPDATDMINTAIDSLSKNLKTFPDYSATEFRIPTATLVLDGDFFINPEGLDPEKDVAIALPEGISLVVNGSLHTNYDGVNIESKGHAKNDRILVYHKLWLGVHDMAEWYVRKGETEPKEKYSVGVRYVNTRSTKAFIEAQGFNKGLDVMGDGDGSVGNIITLGKMYQNREDVLCSAINGGWSNSNTFFSGSLKFYGYINRHETKRVESTLLSINGNGNTFIGTNLEGNINKKYTIQDYQGDNYYAARFEGSMWAETIKFYGRRGSIIWGGTHYYPDAIAKYNKYDDRQGENYVQDRRQFSMSYGLGQLKVNGNKNPLTVMAENGYYIKMARSREKWRHKFDVDGAVYLNTSKNGFGEENAMIFRNDSIINVAGIKFKK